MAYTYMWLKDGRVVAGHISSTYSFSPLRVTDSGRYSCRASLGSINMISEAVTIAVVGELVYSYNYIQGNTILVKPAIHHICMIILNLLHSLLTTYS